MIAIVGTKWGYYLGTQIRKFYCGPMGVCGRDPARTALIASKLRATHVSWSEILHGAEFTRVVLATPPSTHRAMAIEAMTHGKHVYVEKPLATSAEDCKAMLQAAHQTRRTLWCGETVDRRPALIALAARAPAVKNLWIQVECDKDRDRSTPLLLDVGVHAIRTARFLAGDPVRGWTTAGENPTVVLVGANWKATIVFTAKRLAPEIVVSDGTSSAWLEGNEVSTSIEPPSWVSRIKPWSLQDNVRRAWPIRRTHRVSGEDLGGYQAELRAFFRADGDIASAISGAIDVDVVEKLVQLGR